ncbi:hypothetical protein J2741_001937 [Methanolinea mesophila]|uniref:DUF5611 family protein n=1 Tax=Methanolinea mesophila TaxID=547055 RepID=UPI001AE98731|nr:DUF5611 family protein [Methanolinea mesophila]MBP1929390.1 hypothetical protein [Methanolinea mesophila]
MQEYQVKRTSIKTLPVAMVDQLKECFGAEVTEKDGHYRIGYGALTRMEVSLGPGGKTLVVDTESDTGASDETIIDTNKRFRVYLERVTGFTAKERLKKAKKMCEE